MQATAKSLWYRFTDSIFFVIIVVLLLRTFVFSLYHVPSGSAEPTILVGDRIWGNKLAYRFVPIKRGDLVIFDNPAFRYDDSSSITRFWQRYIGLPIFGLPAGPDAWVKRVIAVPGDTIEGRIEDGHPVIYLNGARFDEPYVNPYPLIMVKRNVGFFDAPNLENTFIFSALRQYEKSPLYYSYDMKCALDQQPFYALTQNELALDPISNKPLFRMPNVAEEQDSFPPVRLPEHKYWVMGDSRRNSHDSRYWHFLDESLITGRASFVVLSVDSEEPWFIFELIKHPVDFFAHKLRWARFFKMLK